MMAAMATALNRGGWAEEVKEEDQGKTWEEMYVGNRTPWETGEAASQLKEYCERNEVTGLRCADICCGSGQNAVYLAENGASFVVGFDISETAIEKARSLAEERNVSEKCEFRRADLLEDLSEEELLQNGKAYDLVFDCQGLQILCAQDAEKAGALVSRLCLVDGRLVTIAGNAHEHRPYHGGASSLSVPELVGALSPPFSLISLAETRFDAGEFEDLEDQGPDVFSSNQQPPSLSNRDHQDSGSRPESNIRPESTQEEVAPLAWRAVFVRKTAQHAPSFGDSTPRSSERSRKFFEDNRASSLTSLAKPVTTTRISTTTNSRKKNRTEGPPEIFARKLTTIPADNASTSSNYEDAVDMALSVDGSVAPSDCGSDASGFENIKKQREHAANAERARLAGDVPWVRFWERRAKAYDALTAAQPAIAASAARLAKVALFHARPEYSTHRDDLWSCADLDRFEIVQPSSSSARGQDVVDDTVPTLFAVDLAAGSGLVAWALAKAYPGPVKIDLVEPSHSMAALARARAGTMLRRCHPRSRATIWQNPVERCHERLSRGPPKKVDVVTCGSAMTCLNYFDVLEAASTVLRPGGVLAFDVLADDYEETAEDACDVEDAWVPCVLAALRDRGVEATKQQILNAAGVPPKTRPPLSASSVAAAASASGLRLCRVDLVKDVVPADFFIAKRAISTQWLAEPFSDMPKHDALQLRNVVVLDAAARAARVSAVLQTAIFVVLKPPDASPTTLRVRDLGVSGTTRGGGGGSLASGSKNTCRPMDSALKDDHFGVARGLPGGGVVPVVVDDHFPGGGDQHSDESSSENPPVSTRRGSDNDTVFF